MDGRSLRERCRREPAGDATSAGIPVKWAAAVVVLGIAVVFAGMFGWQHAASDQGRRRAPANRRLQDARTCSTSPRARTKDIRRAAAEEAENARLMSRTARSELRDVLVGSGSHSASICLAPLAHPVRRSLAVHAVSSSAVRVCRRPLRMASLQAGCSRPTEAVKLGTLAPEPDGTVTLVQAVPAILRRVVGVMVTEERWTAGNTPQARLFSASVRPAQAAAPDEAQP